MSERDLFGPAAARLGFRLHWADVRAMADLSRRLAVHGTTPARATATVFVARHEGCDQAALGRALGINRATTMKLVDDLVAQGAVERRAGRDRRSNALHLTPAGHTLRAAIEATMARHDAEAFAALTPGERDVLSHLLTKLRPADTLAEGAHP